MSETGRATVDNPYCSCRLLRERYSLQRRFSCYSTAFPATAPLFLLQRRVVSHRERDRPCDGAHLDLGGLRLDEEQRVELVADGELPQGASVKVAGGGWRGMLKDALQNDGELPPRGGVP